MIKELTPQKYHKELIPNFRGCIYVVPIFLADSYVVSYGMQTYCD